jgi:hypothetical protein
LTSIARVGTTFRIPMISLGGGITPWLRAFAALWGWMALKHEELRSSNSRGEDSHDAPGGKLQDIPSKYIGEEKITGIVKGQPPTGVEEILAVADYFCRSARLRIDHHFAGTTRNVDKRGYALVQDLLAGKHELLREGVV